MSEFVRKALASVRDNCDRGDWNVARDCRVHFTVRRFASAVRVARGSTESRRTGGGCAGYQDILESHRRLVVEKNLDNAPAILVQAAFNNT